MRAKLVNEAVKHLSPTPEDELIFPDSRKAAKYVKNNLFKLTGFQDFEIDINDEKPFRGFKKKYSIKDYNPELKEKLEDWYNANKHKILRKSENDYWDELAIVKFNYVMIEDPGRKYYPWPNYRVECSNCKTKLRIAAISDDYEYKCPVCNSKYSKSELINQ